LVQLSRRDMLGKAVLGTGALLLPAVARAADPLEFRVPPRAGADPLGPQYSAPAGIDPNLLARAKAALDQHADRVRYRDRIAIADFSRHSSESRFHLVDLDAGWSQSFLVTHGRGSDRNHNGFLDSFSNRVGSYATSNGAYVVADSYYGKYGLSAKLYGLDWSNSNAFDRAIVMHHAWYAEPEMLPRYGKLGRSEGCFAFSKTDHWLLMNRLGEGRLLYADKLA